MLATLLIPLKEDPKEKAQVSSTAATTQPPKNPKDNFVIKMKQKVIPPPPFVLVPSFCNSQRLNVNENCKSFLYEFHINTGPNLNFACFNN